jgi:hypothetical protein
MKTRRILDHHISDHQIVSHRVFPSMIMDFIFVARREPPHCANADSLLGLSPEIDDRPHPPARSRVAVLTVLGFAISNFRSMCSTWATTIINGLLGMTFLSDFNDEVQSAERRILAEKIAL